MSIAKLSDLADPTLAGRLVIKVGSALLVDQQREVRRDWLGELAGEIAEAVKRGQHVVVVSSGAIALGAGKLGFEKGGRARLSDAQAAAAVGQIALAGLWAEALGRHGRGDAGPAAQGGCGAGGQRKRFGRNPRDSLRRQ